MSNKAFIQKKLAFDCGVRVVLDINIILFLESYWELEGMNWRCFERLIELVDDWGGGGDSKY